MILLRVFLVEFKFFKHCRMTVYDTDASNHNSVIEGFRVFGFIPKPGYHFHHPTPMGSIARYECDAGSRWNRRIDNFALTTHDVTCQTDGTWTENWPTCIDITQVLLKNKTSYSHSPSAPTQPALLIRTR